MLANNNSALLSHSLNGSLLTLTIQSNETGQSLITVQARDSQFQTVTDSFIVIVNPQNDPPTAQDDSGLAWTTTEDTSPTGLNVLANDFDIDGDPLSVTSFTLESPPGATISIASDGALTYDPTGSTLLQQLQANQTRTVTFVYTVSDGFETSTASVTLTVTGVNDAPIAFADAPAAIPKNQQNVAIDVLGNDSDPEGSALTIDSVNTVPTIGNVSIDRSGSADQILYTPGAGFADLLAGLTRTDSFTYTVTDGEGGFATAVVNIVVSGPNNPPVATNDSTTTFENDDIQIRVLANDFDPVNHALLITAVNGNAITPGNPVSIGNRGGTGRLNADNTITFSPNQRYDDLGVNEALVETFTYTISDNNGGTDPATASITIRGVNDPPNAQNDGYEAVQGGIFTTSDADGSATPTIFNDDGVLGNDVDVDGDNLTVTLSTPPQFGVLTLNADDGTFRYEHNGGTELVDTFEYIVDDGNGGSSVATATITLRPRIPSAWQNPLDARDVNNDGFITPLDGLIIINELNFNGSRPLPNPPVQPFVPPPFLDVNGDGDVSPLDVLIVINSINENGSTIAQAEGEAPLNDVLSSTTSVVAQPDPSATSYGAALARYILSEEDAEPSSDLRERLANLLSSKLADEDAYRLAEYYAELILADEIDQFDVEEDMELLAQGEAVSKSVLDGLFSDDQDWLIS